MLLFNYIVPRCLAWILIHFVIGGISLVLADDKAKFDELVEDKGVKILIDPKALMHVIGTKMDFVDDKLRYSSLS